MRQRVATLHSGMAVLAAPLTPGDYALVPKGEQAGPGLGRPGIAVRCLHTAQELFKRPVPTPVPALSWLPLLQASASSAPPCC